MLRKAQYRYPYSYIEFQNQLNSNPILGTTLHNYL
jgi:hypothetical protein